MVKSKYKWLQISAYILLIILFMTASLALVENTHATTKSIFGCLAINLLGLASMLTFFKNAPRIRFTDNFIRFKGVFGTKEYSWEEVTEVSMTGQEDYSFLFIFSYRMEAMKLTFADGRSLIVWGDHYSNVNEIRSFVSRKLNSRLHFLSEKIPYTDAQFPDKKYAGNAFTSFNTLMIAGTLIFFLTIGHSGMKTKLFLIVPAGITVFFFLLFGIQMYFFEIKDQKLIVRNHYFPWVKIEYDLKDIEEVSKESPYRRSDGLRIITREFISKFYGAGSLRERHWKELFEDLSSLRIKRAN